MPSCLVIIDVQQGFLSEETRHVPEKTISFLKNTPLFDYIVATQFINTENSPYVRFINWSGLMTPDSQAVHPGILTLCEKVFRKKGYSCFTPEFERYIQDKGIDKLYFLGVDTDCCVLKSATDCFERNIPFEVLINYCSSNGGTESHNAAITVLRRTIGEKLINSTL